MSDKKDNEKDSTPSSNEIQRKSIEKNFDKQDEANRQAKVIHTIVGQHDYGSGQVSANPRSLKARIRRAFRPLILKWRKFHYRLEDSSRFVKRWIFGFFVGMLFISIVAAHFCKQGIVVNNSRVGIKKTFVNSDRIRLLHETYDKNNHALRLDFSTSSASGTVSPQDLGTQFILAQRPELHHKVTRPTLNLIPTFNNHFVVIIHNLYSGFDGAKVIFDNYSTLTPATLNNALNNTQNSGGDNIKISNTDKNRIEDLAENGATNYKTSEKDMRIIHHLQKDDYVDFVIGEKNIKSHEGYVNAMASPYHIAMNDLRIHLHNDYKDISANQKLIKIESNKVKSDQSKIRQINRNADTQGKKRELSDTRNEVVISEQGIGHSNHRIKVEQKDVNMTLSRMSKLRNGISTVPNEAVPRDAKLFNKK